MIKIIISLTCHKFSIFMYRGQIENLRHVLGLNYMFNLEIFFLDHIMLNANL